MSSYFSRDNGFVSLEDIYRYGESPKNEARYLYPRHACLDNLDQTGVRIL